MTDSRAAVGLDRLPWLADEPKPRAAKAASGLIGWIVAAVLLIAGVSYWLGMRSADLPDSDARPQITSPTTTVPLPQPKQAQPQVPTATMPEVEPVAAPPSPVAERPAPAHVARRLKTMQEAPAQHAETGKAKSVSEERPDSEDAAAALKVDPHRPWPVRVKDGASGRLVRIGTFSTARQAKKGWWAIMRVNPALKRLPALVVPVQSLRDGRTYYRLQMGTTSQAHSEVLCQRMRIIGQSCVVIEVNNRGQDEVAL
jgi:hypothetical protein